MRKLAIVASVLAMVGLTVVAAAALANRGHGQGGNNFRANLNGYNEVVGGPGTSTGSVSTTGHGRFSLRIFNDQSTTRSTIPIFRAVTPAARTSTSLNGM